MKARRLIAVLLGVVTCVFPLLYLVLLSVADSWPSEAALPVSWSLSRWLSLASGSNPITSSFLVSVSISTAVALTSTAAGYLTGRFVSYHPRRSGLLMLAYVPFVMSPVILGACLMYVYLRLGLAGSVTGVILAQSMFAYGFAIVYFSAFWNRRMKEYDELVRTLGGTTGDAFRLVFIPLSAGPIRACLFHTFLISWFQYGVTLLVGSGRVKTLPLLVYAYVGEASVPQAALAASLLVLPPLLLLGLRESSTRRLTAPI